MKRMLDATAASFANCSRSDLLESIAQAEGRTVCAETIGAVMPLFYDVSNAELAAAFGADMLILNLFDVNNPVFHGIPPSPNNEIIRQIRHLTGRVVGVNLEPIPESKIAMLEASGDPLWSGVGGRLATSANARRLVDLGAHFVVLTANPGMGVTKADLVTAIDEIRREVGEELVIVAGKMHAAATLNEAGRDLIEPEDIINFATAGADIILIPAPGTVPGFSQELVASLVAQAHACGCLAMTAIGTSQEGSDEATIRQIALMSKMAGADIQHIGDAGYTGVAIPENIMALGVAIRGRRHTYRKMAMSINR